MSTTMIIECPECGTRSEVSDLISEPEITCTCEKQIKVGDERPALPQLVSGSNVECSRCNRSYRPVSFRPGTEVLCTCGNILSISPTQLTWKDGRRREDRDRVLQKEELVALIDVCKLMNAAIDTDTLLRTIMKLSTSILKSEGCAILLKSECEEELIFHVVAGDRAAELQQVRIKGDVGVAGWVVRNGKHAIVNSASTDERFSPEVDRATDFTTTSILCVPLRAHHKVIGALEAVNKLSDDGFSLRDLALAEALASQAGEALERARLIDENTRAQRLAAVGET
ncbi:GAF domain-containing protein, partial [Planctomycetota bacterium]